MKDSTKDQIEGKAQEVKGAVKEKIGRAVDDPTWKLEGWTRKLAAKCKRGLGK